LAKKQQPTDTQPDSRKAEQLSRIRAWTERDQKPEESTPREDAEDAA
jgi:hypothetical protein